MMFVFASMGNQASGWPVHLMHQTETAFVIVAFGSVLLGMLLRGIIPYQLFAVVGGIGAGFGLIMPLELAPFFFGARGEIMLGTVALILVYPVAVVIFILVFLKNPATPERVGPALDFAFGSIATVLPDAYQIRSTPRSRPANDSRISSRRANCRRAVVTA